MSLIDQLRSDLGPRLAVPGPYGPRPMVYADFTASGRSLRSIEAYLDERIVPYYANPHSQHSFNGRRTGSLVEQARQRIARSIGAGEEHAVIFCGTGATDAIDKLIRLLALPLRGAGSGSAKDRPLVLIGPYEHHSNELPWRECEVELVVVPADGLGRPDCERLSRLLNQVAPRRAIYGSFSAASNISGQRTDVDRITRILHAHGGLVFWDYAAAGPYDPIDMSGGGDPALGKDAVFISPHKFVGGPDTPGILAVRRSIVRRNIPSKPGGGTVKYVTPCDHAYHDVLEKREEGGTPASIAAIRAGLAFMVKDAVGTNRIREIEDSHIRRALDKWRSVPEILVLGPGGDDRLAILSLMIRRGRRFLHHSFVVQLLNDLFGIQVRGGLFCAGPYAHSLLGIDEEQSRRFFAPESAIVRPGWVRLNLHYLISREEVDFIIAAIGFIASHGHLFLPAYDLDVETGRWRHAEDEQDFAGLDEVAIREDGLNWSRSQQAQEDAPLIHWLEEAERLAQAMSSASSPESRRLAAEAEALRWYWAPWDDPSDVGESVVEADAGCAAEAFQAVLRGAEKAAVRA